MNIIPKTCLIISGGEFCPLPPDPGAKPDLIIACDRGYEYAARLGLRPDRIVGDFDSAPMPATDIPIRRVPTRKDDTDTMLAARMALDLDCGDVTVCCALGGRLDHAFSNIQTGAFLAAHGASARVLGTDTDIHIFTGKTLRLPRKPGWSLSLFALSDACEGVTVRGTKYECENETFTNAFPLGVSNVWTADTAEVTVERGILMVLQSKLKEGEHI